MRIATLFFLAFSFTAMAAAQPVIQVQHYGWEGGRTRNFRVGGFSSSSYDLTTGTGKTWTFATPTGTDYQNTTFVTSSGTTTFPTANLRMDYNQVTTGYPSSGSTYLAVGDSDIAQLGYTGAPNTVWNPPIPTGLPHRLNKTWQGDYSYGFGSYHIVGTVVSSGMVTTQLGTYSAVLVRYNYSNVLIYTVYQWETQEYGIVASANTLNGGMLYVLTQATPNNAVGELRASHPNQFKMSEVYPNPTNGNASLQLSIPTAKNVRISVVNLLGEEVAQIAEERMSAGERRFTFETGRFPSGNYWVVANAGGKKVEMKPITVVR